MSHQGQSVSLWIQDLKDGQQEAASRLWDRYFDRMVVLARKKLGNAEKRVADEEDLAISVFHALCDGASAGRFGNLENRDDLWLLLIAITGNKAVDQVRRQTSQKRGGGEVRGNSIFRRNDGTEEASFEGLLGENPTPELLVSVDEEYGRLLDSLHDDVQRQIVRLKLAGHQNKEIAEKVGISLRSVERKLQVIRDAWAQEFDEHE